MLVRFPIAICLFSLSATAAAQVPKHGLHVLYNQIDDGTRTRGIWSQMFDSDYHVYDSQAADDFTIPTGQFWVIKAVGVLGGFSNNGTPTSENVFFYHDRNGKPGKPVHNGTFLNLIGDNIAGEQFYNPLPGRGLKLQAGHYWLSFQVNMPYSQGYWLWGTEDLKKGQGGDRAVWKNPGNGWGTNCLKYRIETKCWPDGEGHGHLFTIFGAAKNTPR